MNCCMCYYVLSKSVTAFHWYMYRFEDFVQMVVSNSRGGSSVDFEYDAVSHLTLPFATINVSALYLY